jgi:hypothetical protein
MANGDPVAEAQKVLDEWNGDGTGDAWTFAEALASMITLNRSLLEPLGDEGRKLARLLRVAAQYVCVTYYPENLRLMADIIERQSAALSTFKELVRAAYIEGFNASENTSMSADTMWEMSDARALTGGTSHE